MDARLQAPNQTGTSGRSVNRLADPAELDRIVDELND
jgi:hypothetical protein